MISIRSFDSVLRIGLAIPGLNHRAPIKGQGVRQSPTAPRRPAPRRGVTLLELIVVIALLGLILAIAAPAFILPSARPESELTTVVATARRAAIVRGEPVTLALIESGAWRIDGDATPTASPIATGKLGASIGAIRIRVSPMGTCVADPLTTQTAADWNALECRFGLEPVARPAR